MAPQRFPDRTLDDSLHHSRRQRLDKEGALSQFDNLLRGVILPNNVRLRLRALLVSSIEQKAYPARGGKSVGRMGSGGKVDLSKDAKAMRGENAALQRKMAAMKKEHEVTEETLAEREKELQELKSSQEKKEVVEDRHGRSHEPGELRGQDADLGKEVSELRKEVKFLQGIVDDRGDGGLLALYEGGSKLFEKQQSDRVNALTARIGEAVHAAETARLEKDEAVSTLQARLVATTRENVEGMVTQESLKAELKEKNATIATMKAMSRPSLGVVAPHIPDVEQTLIFVQNLQRDVAERDQMIADLRTGEARLQAKQTEMLAFGAARKTAQLELQSNYDALKNEHRELGALMSDSQKLNKRLDLEHEKLVKELGRKF